MNLFNKDKELILKLTNAVLLIWLIAAIVISFNLLLDLTLRTENLSYEEWKVINCSLYDSKEVASTEENCKQQYDSSKVYDKRNAKVQRNNFLVGLFNIATVSAALCLLNKNKDQKKKK